MKPPRATKTSLRDVAEVAGVAIPTVSRILNKQTKGFSVKPDVRKRVMDAVHLLNYRPNVLAQSLRKERMSLVSLLNFQPDLYYLREITAGLVDVLKEHGVGLCTSYASSPHSTQGLPPFRTDGAVVVSAMKDEELEPIERAEIPYVSINGTCGPSGASVSFDDTAGTTTAMEYLIRLGHRKIAYVGPNGPWINHVSVRDRHDAYLATLRRHGLSPMPYHDHPFELNQHKEINSLATEHGVTAIVAYHSFYAVDIHSTLQRLGLRMPHDVSLLCLDGGYPLNYIYPTVTAVSLPFTQAGRIAAEMLLAAFDLRESGPRKVVLEEGLDLRESTAPVGRR